MSSPPTALPVRFADPQLLGRGSQGQTFAALDTAHDRRVAVKVLTLGASAGWKGFELFERECATLRAIDHRSIPTYYEHFGDEARGQYYLVMELIEGRPLSLDLAEAHRRSEPELLALLDAVLDVLDYLHGLRPPVVHRDIKPGNLIRCPDGRIVLVDFGGVMQALGTKGGSTMIGTFGYMAPEQLYGRSGPQTDLYALGATIAALAGGVEAEDLPRRGMDIDVEAVVQSAALVRALEAMCASDPDVRAASVAEVRAAIADPPGALAPLPPRIAVDSRTPPNSLGRFIDLDALTSVQRRIVLGGTLTILGASMAIGRLAFGFVGAFLFTALFVFVCAVVRGFKAHPSD